MMKRIALLNDGVTKVKSHSRRLGGGGSRGYKLRTNRFTCKRGLRASNICAQAQWPAEL